jgi:hypothetical protein
MASRRIWRVDGCREATDVVRRRGEAGSVDGLVGLVGMGWVAHGHERLDSPEARRQQEMTA